MSYYSKIGIVLYRKDFEEMLKQAKTQPEKTKTDIDYILSNSKITTYSSTDYPSETETDFIRIISDYVKWYEDDDNSPGVKFIKDFIENCNHDFLRLGEEFGDKDDRLDFGHICHECNVYINTSPDIKPNIKYIPLSRRFNEVRLKPDV